ncbi:D-alanyl-D-alanine carboxypeptidase [Asanoa hainanensis]|uniref:D-alanyl-D-alanine carboxypeptidase n=1 Tax=Asanoa hainanensis TaxID=560556 RepID=A0A239GFM9_9ACTN|nr:M15 family metallopeptidase [Asanoa hainanensis]SNS67548.1 D-alanyl-D-alanine carboxypeptidase [Asanoa hainanensis]
MVRSKPYRLAVLAVALVIAGCAGQPAESAAWSPPSDSPPPPSTSPSAPAEAPAFSAATEKVTAADLGASWKSGCPVGPASLRLLRLSYWGFDDEPHTGGIVVHKDVAADVTAVFRTLFAKRFPIRSLKPVSEYGGSDDKSMAADNTSAFNCRNAVSSGKPSWSVHAYGKAIDVNPVENPYLFGDEVLPPSGREFVDRSPYRPGMAVKGGVLVKAFASVGWKWNVGGANPDYQHFSTTGH